jgi:hypothetical protein
MPKCEISVVVDGGTTPLTDTWIYMAEGDTVSTWRAGPDGKVMKLHAGGDAAAATRSWKYDEKLTLEVPKTARFYSSRGARPLPAKILEERVFSNAHAWVERKVELPAEATHDVAPGDTAVIALRTAVIALPPIHVALTTPEELSILPVLWDHAPQHDTDDARDYLRAGFDQKVVDAHEGTASAAPPADVEPHERGIVLKGTIDARANHVRVVLFDPSGNAISMRPLTATATPAKEAVVATSAASGHRGFEVRIWLEKPTKAFGAVQVLIESADDEAVHIVGMFSIVLVGMQIALVDDTAANENGKEPGPFVGQAGELIVHDFTDSPVCEPASSDLFLKAFASAEHARDGVHDKGNHLNEVIALFARGKKTLARVLVEMGKAISATRLPAMKTELLATKAALEAAKGKQANAGSAAPAITRALDSRALDTIDDDVFDAEAPPLASALHAVDTLLEPAATNATTALTKALADAGDALDKALAELEHESATTVDAARNEAKAKRLLATTAAKTSLDAAEAARAAGEAAATSAHTAAGAAGVKSVLDAIDGQKRRLKIDAQTKADKALYDKGRVRRMARYPIRATRKRKLAGTGPEVLHPEMPMWMAELHLFGLDQPVVEDLLARRKRLLAGNPTSITVSVDWQLRFRWKAPDMGSGGRAQVLDDTVRGVWTETGLQNVAQEIVLAIDGEDALAVDGDAVKNAFKIPPVALPYPVADRRKPVVAMAHRSRAWGRATGAVTASAAVVEWQVPVVDAAGKEKMRGGDGELSIVALSVGGSPIPLGVPAIPAATPDPPIKLVLFRMQGMNTELWPNPRREPPPSSPDLLSAAIDAVIEDAYGKLPATHAARAVDLAGWKQMMRSIIWWESGNCGRNFTEKTVAQFVHEEGTNPHARSYGQQAGTPTFGYPHGFTLAQLDNPPPSDDARWSFLEAIRSAITLVFNKAETARSRMLPRGFDAGNRRHREVLLRDTVRQYNSGDAEFRWGRLTDHTTAPTAAPFPRIGSSSAGTARSTWSIRIRCCTPG